ncbi:MAG: O-methyltransferase, partial [Bacteroidia bacterium]|nr:O-methyltransferase [Bacteroidia bacterium]
MTVELPPALADYTSAFTAPEPEYLVELSRQTWLYKPMPRMLSGHLQGRILALFSRLVRPKVVVEIGTYTGYSALCLAEGLLQGGTVYTIDVDEENSLFAQTYFDRSPYAQNIRRLVGPALEKLDDVPEPVDLAFIDADKENYTTYYRILRAKMRSGGLILADNVLWSGKVVNPDVQDPET